MHPTVAPVLKRELYADQVATEGSPTKTASTLRKQSQFNAWGIRGYLGIVGRIVLLSSCHGEGNKQCIIKIVNIQTQYAYCPIIHDIMYIDLRHYDIMYIDLRQYTYGTCLYMVVKIHTSENVKSQYTYGKYFLSVCILTSAVCILT